MESRCCMTVLSISLRTTALTATVRIMLRTQVSRSAVSGANGGSVKTVVQPICDMLIDQDRYIGSDPVGHYCGNPASHVLCGSHFICDSCAELLQSNPSRVTIPAHGSVIGWNDRVKTVLNSMLNRH